MENNIKDLRHRQGLQQKEMADELGLAKNTFSQYENGIRKVPPDILIQIAEKYEVSIDYLIGFCNNPHGTKYGGLQLTAEEETLVTAWRQADQRAKDDVAHALRNFGFEQEEPQEKEEPA